MSMRSGNCAADRRHLTLITCTSTGYLGAVPRSASRLLTSFGRQVAVFMTAIQTLTDLSS
jgi:hypothetical protein